MRLEPTTTFFVKEHCTWPNWPNDGAEFWVLICTVHLTVCSCRVTYAFHSQSTLYICLNAKKLLIQNRREFGCFSHCNRTQTHNHLVRKLTLLHLGKLTKWLSWFVSTYLYIRLGCMFLSCHVHVSDWILTVYLTEYQGTPNSK